MQTAKLSRQRLKEFTVEVRDCRTDEAAGTGVLVSADGLAVTCSHVVRACGVDPRAIKAGEVLVQLPTTPGHDAIIRLAEVVWYPPDHDDDLVILKLAGGPIPPERVGICGPAGDAEEVAFKSWGFRKRGEYRGLMARGVIETRVDSKLRYLAQALQLRSADLDSGMSGAAVLDVERNIVVGFVFQVWDDPDSQKDRDLAFAVDAALLAHSPLHASIVDTALPLAAAAPPVLHPAVGLARSTELGADRAGPSGLPLPEHLGKFVGRDALLAKLAHAWADPTIKIIGITGLVGEGKTSLVRQWVAQSGIEHAVPPSRPPVWWSFDPTTAEEDDFLTVIIRHLLGPDARTPPSAAAKAHLAAALLPTVSRLAVVLDDVSPYQVDRGDLYGTFRGGALKDFLLYSAAADHDSLVILTSELPFPDLEPIKGFEQVEVGPMDRESGRQLLLENGVTGAEEVLDQLVDEWGGNAQALTAVAIYLKTRNGGIASRAADLPRMAEELPFENRLQAIGNAIQERRGPVEQVALELLALARRPLKVDVLLYMLRELSNMGLGPSPPPDLDDLTRSAAVRASAVGLAPHPVLRALYRKRLRVADPRLLRACHRLLGNHYYSAGASGS
jgi:hypothetical protein